MEYLDLDGGWEYSISNDEILNLFSYKETMTFL